MGEEILKDEVEFVKTKDGKTMITMSDRDFETVFKLSGSKAKTKSGKRKAVGKVISEGLKALVKKHEKNTK